MTTSMPLWYVSHHIKCHELSSFHNDACVNVEVGGVRAEEREEVDGKSDPDLSFTDAGSF